MDIEVRQIGAVSGYDILTVGGMNEAGLNAGLRWLNTTDFPEWTCRGLVPLLWQHDVRQGR